MKFEDYLNEEVAKLKNTAGVAIIYQNKILLVHPTGASWTSGKCGIPKGGIEPGEDPLDAAIREVREETGIRLSPNQLDPSPETVTLYKKNGSVRGQLIYFVCRIDDLSEIGLDKLSVPKSQLQLSEVDWAKFVGPEEAYPLIWQPQLIILDRNLSLSK